MPPLQSVQAILFDLDGTLIDSAPSILRCFGEVLNEIGIPPLVPLNDSLIGPPLKKTLQMITGLDNMEQLDLLVARFKRVYDTRGYLETRVYAGVEEMLATLRARGILLSIATNKRKIPTLKILKHLGWHSSFQLIGSLDTPASAHADKASLIASMLEELGLPPAATLYVGDKHDDGLAAQTNNMLFAAVAWGYGVWDDTAMPYGWRLLKEPAHLCGEAG